MMNRRELEQWLGAVETSGLGFNDIAEVLHLVLGASRRSLSIADADELRTLRFTLAVLRDVFASDADVRGWLATPLAALGGRSPTDLLTAGRVHDLADLAVREWNGPRPAGRVHHLRSFAPSVSAR